MGVTREYAESGSTLFELFENAGVVRAGEPSVDQIDRLTRADIVRLAEESCVLTAVSGLPPAPGVYTHSSTLTMGGWPQPCSSVGCRTQRTAELGQFAALYSDHVYVPNVMMQLTQHVDDPTIDVEWLRRSLLDNLSVLCSMRPLVEAGRIVPVTPEGTRCPSCFSEGGEGPVEAAKRARVHKVLSSQFFGLIDVEVEYDDDDAEYRLRYIGPEDLFEHSYIRPATKRAAKVIDSMPRLRARSQSGESIAVGEATRRKLGLHQDLAREVIRDVNFELAIAQHLGSSFLTEHAMHITALNALSADRRSEERNQVVSRHLTSLLPFVGDIDSNDLMLLRQREEEAFILFRKALNAAISEVRQEGTAFTERHARQLYSDVLQPKLAELDRKVKLGKRGMRSMFGGAAGSVVSSLSFGLITHLASSNPLATVGAIGGAALVHRLTERIGDKRAANEEAIRSDDLYFLWRVRQLTA